VAQSRTTWVGWSGTPGTIAPFTHDGVALEPVSLSDDDIAGFYTGFANATIWPLYHDAIFPSQFDDAWWHAYERVNQRFTERVAAVAATGASVWIHDYQLQLVPEMLRQVRPDLRIGFFLHVPFPSQELFLRLPWRERIANGILGADVVGFQTQVGAENFRAVARRLLNARSAGRQLVHDRRNVTIATIPVGIDAAGITAIASAPSTVRRAAEIRRELGGPRTVLLGVDRMDYTKGITIRLAAYRELLEEGRVDPNDTVLVQIAQPSRGEVPGYADIREEVERIVGGINGDFGRLGGVAVKYLHQSQPLEELVALYRAADVMLVTPLRDGMNLIAKEYIASRRQATGTLVLSEFAGAAHELTQAALVNPYDINRLKQVIAAAVSGERRLERRAMLALARTVRRNDAQHWSDTFLRALAAY
jgi:alpha,alpha-trehalose-phosphate synthase [UDP-forming]